MCSWKKIPKPATDSDPIAVATGPLEQHKDASGNSLRPVVQFINLMKTLCLYIM